MKIRKSSKLIYLLIVTIMIAIFTPMKTQAQEEVQNEMNALKEHSDISYETCLETILHQKAIEKYASEFQITADKARSYYENNKWRYGEAEPDFEKVKSDMQMEMGVAKYEERLYKIREECKVSIIK